MTEGSGREGLAWWRLASNSPDKPGNKPKTLLNSHNQITDHIINIKAGIKKSTLYFYLYLNCSAFKKEEAV